ncbi:hypothetical protein PIB30_102871 [Stylosanthes scabra]|uniref:Uncharacterized protein n=1 Tax=Stylosanthes scabra TaxID=79078 RepID=A0ABU6VW87_9FABA|nr:hypothetical protein [Stylosanthes scabra]
MKAISDYFVYKGKDVIYHKNEKNKVKTLYNEHSYGKDQVSNLAIRAWCTSKLVKRLATQPDMKPRHAMDFMIEEYNLQLNPRMLSRALKAAREEVVGNEAAQ